MLAKVSPISVLLVIAVLAVAVNLARDKVPMSWWANTGEDLEAVQTGHFYV